MKIIKNENYKLVVIENDVEIEYYDFEREITFSNLTKNLLQRNLDSKIELNIDETIEFTEEENNLVSIVKEIITNYNNKVEEFDKFKNNFE